MFMNPKAKAMFAEGLKKKFERPVPKKKVDNGRSEPIAAPAKVKKLKKDAV